MSVCVTLFFEVSLEFLDLSHNPLTKIPLEVGNLQLLKELEVWEVGIGLLKKMSTFRADFIGLQEWPPQIDQIDKLKTLSFDNNSISAVPTSIQLNSCLEELSISSNALSAIPSEIFSGPLKV